MTTTDLDTLRFPIGKFKAPDDITFKQIQKWMKELELFPDKMYAAASGLSDEQLDTPYRPGGWTLRQVIHHLPDSHMNAYIRFKLAVTEDNPSIRPYMEDRWANCLDGIAAPIGVSLNLLDAVHQRWVMFLRILKPEDFERTYVHPEHGKISKLATVLAMYIWHGEHHLHHILMTRKSNNW